jgi:hypothetical protein
VNPNPTACAFCRTATTDLCISHRVDLESKVHTGALCGDCIRWFILEMAHADPERFERLVEEARAENSE